MAGERFLNEHNLQRYTRPETKSSTPTARSSKGKSVSKMAWSNRVTKAESKFLANSNKMKRRSVQRGDGLEMDSEGRVYELKGKVRHEGFG